MTTTKERPWGIASGDGNVWIQDGRGEYREARGRDERLAGLESFITHCKRKQQQRVESVTDPAIQEVLEQDWTTDEMEEYLGRPMTMAERSYACRATWNRDYAPRLQDRR